MAITFSSTKKTKQKKTMETPFVCIPDKYADETLGLAQEMNSCYLGHNPSPEHNMTLRT